jgi:hypothetical protein
MDLKEIGMRVCIALNWLRTGTGGGLLWVRWWTFVFLRHGVSWVEINNLFWVETPSALH